ncbi:MAG: hypothetical protein PVI11_02995 [Candidatus Aminicenantes bacterium]|jgi:DNA-directed RNA polymerase subunit RPC12/RpoP
MKKKIKCPLCGSRKVMENPVQSEIRKKEIIPHPGLILEGHKYKCLKCGNEFD